MVLEVKAGSLPSDNAGRSGRTMLREAGKGGAAGSLGDLLCAAAGSTHAIT